ncbi:MAG: Trk system potassium transporter TrkA [Candidatus Lambdaproteobacteria bacterium]|nr:Trk system potassium transporter TrkA [Candidatus Lambdaproteobacteria bacterium]
MKVAIAGAGEVGYNVVGALYREGVEIVAIDSDPAVLEQLREEYAIRTVQGNAIDPDVFEQAGVGQADLFLAVTNFDETNLIACLMAHEAGARKKIARVKTIDFGLERSVSDQNFLGIDLIINPYEVVAEHLTHLVQLPQATDYSQFLNDRVALVRVPIGEQSPLAGQSVLAFGQDARISRTLIALIQRDAECMMPSADLRIERGDQVYFISERAQLQALFRYLRLRTAPARRVFINGGGRIGYALARRLEKLGLDLRILEISEERCRALSQQLDRTIVLNADGTDSRALKAEGVGDADLFISVTAADPVNVVSCLLAKEYGATHTVALVKQQEAVPVLLAYPAIDIPFSPRLLTARKLLRFVRGGKLDSFFSFPNSDIELLELQILPGMKCERGTLASLKLPAGVLIGAVKRGREIFIPNGLDRLVAGDTILLIQQRRNRNVTRSIFLDPEPLGDLPRERTRLATAGG